MTEVSRDMRDVRILSGIARYVAEHGFSPCAREVQEMAGYHSSSSVQYAFWRLQHEGLITWQKGIARTVRLTPSGEEMVASWQ